jgi:large subunit ribosomal protein L24
MKKIPQRVAAEQPKKRLLIRKNDTVKVISGNSRGKTGKVLRVFPEKERIIVEGVNLVARHRKPSQTNPQGGITRQEAPIHVSNVLYFDAKAGQATRLGKSEIINEKTGKKRHARRSVATGDTLE